MDNKSQARIPDECNESNDDDIVVGDSIEHTDICHKESTNSSQSSSEKSKSNKREKKLITKIQNNKSNSTCMSKGSPFVSADDEDESDNTKSDAKNSSKKSYPRNRVKKKDQYRNQVIEDQYGRFEYDIDPKGYLKARKRMLNRQSALRTRSRKDNKFDDLSSKIKFLEGKSTNLEKENMQLKSEKETLQKQIQDLMAIVNSMKAGEMPPESHKRIKVSETNELPSGLSLISPSKIPEFCSTEKTVNSDFRLNGRSEFNYKSEDDSSDVQSSSEEEVGVLKTQKWLQQNDVLSQIQQCSKSNNLADCSSHTKELSVLEPHDEERFVLHRDNESQALNSLFGDVIGDAISQGSMMILNIVMCLILCFCSSSFDEGQNMKNRDFSAHRPDMRKPMTHEYSLLSYHSNFYMFGILCLVFISAALFIKIRSWIKFEAPRPKSKKLVRDEPKLAAPKLVK